MSESTVVNAPMKRGGTMPMRVLYTMETPEPMPRYGNRSPYPVIQGVTFLKGTTDRSDLVNEERLRELIHKKGTL